MDRAAYARMATNEGSHWWFASRREIIATILKPYARPEKALRILEVGCGSGGNLAMLKNLGQLDAIEYDREAMEFARARSGVDVVQGALPDDLPVPDAAYDLIVLTDVLEHIGPDRSSIAALSRKLAPGGRLLVTVPAMPWLWSAHDVVHHHHRRYTRASLGAVIEAGGMRIEKIGYFNMLLFPLAVFLRALKFARGDRSGDDVMPSPMVNRALRALFTSEKHLIGRVRFAFGLSVYAVAGK